MEVCLVNLKLKLALLSKFGSQTEAAQRLGLHESRLSRLVRSRVRASREDKEALARVYGERHAQILLGQRRKADGSNGR